jgi:hypothetical protein
MNEVNNTHEGDSPNETIDNPSGEAVRPSKFQLVKDAMEALGSKAGRQELCNWVKRSSGIDIPLQLVSSYRSQMTRKHRGPRPIPKPVSIEDTVILKELAKKYGRAVLIRLVEDVA